MSRFELWLVPILGLICIFGGYRDWSRILNGQPITFGTKAPGIGVIGADAHIVVIAEVAGGVAFVLGGIFLLIRDARKRNPNSKQQPRT